MLDEQTITNLAYQIALEVGQLEQSEQNETKPPPETLYHYTTAEGLTGIVRSGELWASNVLYLNDESELSNAADLFKKQLDEQPLGLPEEVDFLRAIHARFEDSDVEHFAVSFCEDGDLLEQWRAYGGVGSGYALGFKSAALTRSLFGMPLAWTLRKVLYEESAKRKLVRDRLAIVGKILVPCEAELRPATDADYRLLITLYAQISLTFHAILPLMKHRAFELENEWRLLRSIKFAAGSKDIKVRPVEGGLRPYTTNRWLHPHGPQEAKYDGLMAVSCGPSREADLKHRACKRLLANHGFAGTQVISSSVPLRT